MRTLKVVHVTETFVTGVYSYIKDLCEESSKNKKIKNIIIYSNKREGNLNELLPQDTQLLEIEMFREINFRKDYSSLISLFKLLNRIKPDVLHVHSSKAGFLGRICYIFLRNKPKLFYTPHGFSFLRKDISKPKKRFYFFLEKTTYILSKSTIVASGDTELNYAKKIGKSILIRNGVNLDIIPPKSNMDKKNKAITIGILGRITFARNPKLFNRIAQNFPKIKFIWIGGGELSHELTSDNIYVTGWFSEKKQGLKYLNHVDIYIQTSLWEGLPIAVLEAMAFKKPIIASNIIGNKDAVIHNETGFLFNNFQEACCYIETLIQQKDLREKLGYNGFERCKTYFNTKLNFKELLSYYEN